jgi:glutamate dehydrogenase
LEQSWARRHTLGREDTLTYVKKGTVHETDPRSAPGVERLGGLRALEEMLAAARSAGSPEFRLVSTSLGVVESARCVVAWPQQAPMLSDVVPLFETLGLRLEEHRPLRMERAEPGGRYVDEFGLRFTATVLDADVARLVEEALVASSTGRAETDGFNRLVLVADLGWREVSVLRAASRYLRQAGLTLSQPYFEQTLARHPEFARLLVDLFTARFDPRLAHAERHTEKLDIQLAVVLEQAVTLDEDRILRGLRDFVHAIVRTNYFQHIAGAPKRHLAFKLNTSRLPMLPRPRPLVETFVYSPTVEGLHLRGGRVARGGIRWSDRPEDFRNEVLGLMKAQMVKNAVIVPAGAKGAFVVKQPIDGLDRESIDRVVRDSYATFIRGLLDITDNIVGGDAAHPADTVVLDEPDPYLVVAADKGTAALSDLANAVAAEYQFWLGDAFASGGSSGYDHKAMGITARGAWESVRRHFHEMGLDVDRDEFTVAGIGDMSGDVFGNGMLLSRCIRLVAAFDHRHVFLDPEPDAETSHVERQRLYHLPHSSWADYDSHLISTGGGVYPRSAKAIKVTPQVRERLCVSSDVTVMTPQEMVRAILQAPVDLLWNGGIGTYVKASGEQHSEVGDPANDPVRVDARNLRCRVVGEGGNLGFTQLARTEYALAGGRINSDFIDNSAGVDTSDHEVNIKILLDGAVADGELPAGERNALLARMEPEVAVVVLEHNRLQTQAISVAEAHAPVLLDQHVQLIRNLEQAADLDRRLENLPDEKTINDRRNRGSALTRPEIAVLLAYAKNLVCEELLASDVPEDPALRHVLHHYFPVELRTRFPDRIFRHPLAREIIATLLANELIDHVGPGFLYRIEEHTGVGTADAARAYAIGWAVYRLQELWEAVDQGNGRISAKTQHRILREQQRLLERVATWLLRHRRPPLDIGVETARFSAPTQELERIFPKVMLGDQRVRFDGVVAEFTSEGVDLAMARRVAALAPLSVSLDLAELSSTMGRSLVDVASIHFRLDAELQLDWLREHVRGVAAETHWTLMAKAALRDELGVQHRRLVSAALRTHADIVDPAHVVAGWLTANHARVQRCVATFAELRQQPQMDVAMLTVAVQELQNLAQTGG